jgi:hypothetical protein
LLNNLLENWNQVLDVRDLLFEDQDVGVFENGFHAGCIGDEVRRQVTAIELHTFDEFEFGLQALAFVDGEPRRLCRLFPSRRPAIADFAIVVGSDRSDVGHFALVFDLDRHLLKLFGDVGHGLFDPGLHLDWVHAGDNSLEAFVEDRFGHNGCGGGAVASDVAGLAGDFANHASAHVFVDVFQVDFLGNGHTVFGDGWAAKALLQNDVAALGTEVTLTARASF